MNFVHESSALSSLFAVHAAPWADALADALVASIWTGLLLAAGTWTVLRLLPGLSAARRSSVWFAVLLAALALPMMPLLRNPAMGPTAVPSSHAWGVVIGHGWSLVLVGLSLLLSAWRAAALCASALRLRTMARRAQPVEVPTPVAVLLAATPRPALLCESPDVLRPSVAGFGEPRVLIPAGWCERLTEGELQQIVLHELAHLARRDDWTNLLQKLALAAFPLNPVLFWLDRRLSLERELACDDAVLGRTGARKAYAACLVSLAERSTLFSRGLSLALGAWDRQSELARRVQRILAQPGSAMSPARARLAVGTIATGLATSAVLLARAPQVIRFAPQAAAPAQVAAAPALPPLPAVAELARSRRPSARMATPAQRKAATVVADVQPVAAAVAAAIPQPVPAAEPHAVFASADMNSGSAAARAVSLSADRTASRRVGASLAARPLTPHEWSALRAAWNGERQRRLARRVAAERELMQIFEVPPTFAAVSTPDGWVLVQL